MSVVHEYIFSQGRSEFDSFHRHIEIDIPVEQFDDSETIKIYAEQFQSDGHLHETLDEAAERVAGLLKDDSAAMRFKSAVRKMRRNRCQ